MTASLANFWALDTPNALLDRERKRLVRFCAHLTGDAAAAEDLAQEAMLEAWRTLDRVNDPADFSAWLNGCARNVCRRWMTKRGRDRARFPAPILDGNSPSPEIADDFDLELELERSDLADLLDRALGLLPRDTRDAMIQHYVEERSQAEIAGHLGSNEGAIAVRIHRGKLALKNALGWKELRPLAETFGLLPAGEEPWTETRIWCPVCGRLRLRGYAGDDGTPLRFRCPECHKAKDWHAINGNEMGHILTGIKTFRPAFTRCANYVHEHYRDSLVAGEARCLACGTVNRIHFGHGAHTPPDQRDEHGFHFVCNHCGLAESFSLAAIVLFHPEGQRFQRDHQKIRLLPERAIEAGGVRAVVTTFESLTGASHFDVVSAEDTFRVLTMRRS